MALLALFRGRDLMSTIAETTKHVAALRREVRRAEAVTVMNHAIEGHVRITKAEAAWMIDTYSHCLVAYVWGDGTCQLDSPSDRDDLHAPSVTVYE